MRHLIFMFVFLIHLRSASYGPETATERFFLDYWKYMGLRDISIFHEDFIKFDENGSDVTEYAINYHKFLEDPSPYTRKYEAALVNENHFWERHWSRWHVARFTEDLLLELRECPHDKLRVKWLMIPDSSMKGGYKLLEIMEFNSNSSLTC